MVKLIDIYPDGYEAYITHGTLMARYHAGFDSPSPLEKNRVYRLDIDLWSTALVFAKNHRIGMYITGSDPRRFRIHPNSYDPVDTYKDAPVACNSIHTSDEYPSKIIIPVIEPGVSVDYDPAKHHLCKKTAPWDK